MFLLDLANETLAAILQFVRPDPENAYDPAPFFPIHPSCKRPYSVVNPSCPVYRRQHLRGKLQEILGVPVKHAAYVPFTQTLVFSKIPSPVENVTLSSFVLSLDTIVIGVSKMPKTLTDALNNLATLRCLNLQERWMKPRMKPSPPRTFLLSFAGSSSSIPPVMVPSRFYSQWRHSAAPLVSGDAEATPAVVEALPHLVVLSPYKTFDQEAPAAINEKISTCNVRSSFLPSSSVTDKVVARQEDRMLNFKRDTLFI
jgi:hypothetical protein